ncbi:hypothetical protein FL966_00560 [Caproiciproducens galactitolivorans]|uniref:Peptidase C39-like domain-containing protein n=1 Tax=Caproiciproducens galactitolivorans TaxID=642589 RepID=A0A4Z0YBL5_9FIRM|nr:C39 family peptidase [Caproiciproducens galactitolivorans]QEY33673.1 hypothetical protein FL966_00560 [Caproiciproducens galactitolivorans]TGJ76203.1 hypothetical protein CAGA_16640 [Caproiciproducens galactitolivorans]
MKKLLSLVLVAVLLLSASSSAFAATKDVDTNSKYSVVNNTSFQIENDYVKAFVKHMHNTDISISGGKTLKDGNGHNAFLCVTFKANQKDGYAIVNLADLKIIELSLNHSTPFSIADDIIYMGPLDYIKVKGGKGVNIRTNHVIPLAELSSGPQTKSGTIDNAIKQTMIEKLSNNPRSATRVSIPGAGDPSWAFNAGSYYGDCGINGLAMLEKWYDKYVSNNYLPSSLSSEKQIKRSIYNTCISSGYPTTGISERLMASLITAYSKSVGQNGYYLYAVDSPYDWASVCKRVDDNLPTLLSTEPGTPKYNYHYVISVGYADDGDPSNNQLYINDGWKNYVWLSSSYLHEMLPTY